MSERKEGIGLSNTRARLHQLYGAEQKFEIIPRPQGGVIARVRIPFRLAEDCGVSLPQSSFTTASVVELERPA